MTACASILHDGLCIFSWLCATQYPHMPQWPMHPATVEPLSELHASRPRFPADFMIQSIMGRDIFVDMSHHVASKPGCRCPLPNIRAECQECATDFSLCGAYETSMQVAFFD